MQDKETKLDIVSSDHFVAQEHVKVDISNFDKVSIHETSVDIPITREMITAPLFIRGKKNKKNEQQIFYLNAQKSRKIVITPYHDNIINTEFEERVFMALIEIAKRQQIFFKLSLLPQKIITTISQIIKTMGIRYDTKYKNRVHEALHRLRDTKYFFYNCFYSPELDDYNGEVNAGILGAFHYKPYTVIKDSNPEIINYFHGDKRIKQFVFVEISWSFYSNLVHKKAYLNFDSQRLLEIENGVARKIYMYCDRQRWQDDLNYKEKGDDLKFKVTLQMLIYIIPLSFHNNLIPSSFKIILEAFEYLKKIKLIVDFIVHREKPIKNSWFEVFFEQSRKYLNKENFEELPVVSTETKLLKALKWEEEDWEKFENFYYKVFGTKDKDLIKDFNESSKIKLIDEFKSNEFRAISLAQYVLSKGNDINAYLFKSEYYKYISENDILKLKNNYEKKLKQETLKKEHEELEKEKKLMIEQEKQQELINQNLLQNEFHKLTDTEKEPYLKYADILLKKISGTLSSFLRMDIIEVKILFCIFAKSTDRSYDHSLELYLENSQKIKLDIRDMIIHN